MNVIVVHNYYRTTVPSGENSVVDSECELLRSHGHRVIGFFRRSDDLASYGPIRMAWTAVRIPWNPDAARKLRTLVEEVKPDVVHVHNTFPMISPSIFRIVGSRAAKVLTMHNFRLYCAKAIPMRNGKPCTKCLDRRASWPAVWHACYRDSHIASVPAAMSVYLHRRLRTWDRDVDTFIALSDFQRKLMVGAGLPAGKVLVRPNFFPGNPTPLPWEDRGRNVVFAGRVSPEKGVDLLVESWLEWGPNAPSLRIVGDGPLLRRLRDRAARCRATNIHFTGRLSASETQAEIARASLLVVPSVWFEGFPLVIREAFAFGTPVAVAEIGALSEIVKSGVNGVSFRAGDRKAICRVVEGVMNDPDELKRLGIGARRAYEDFYSEQAGYESLMAAYDQTIARANKVAGVG